jgi:anaerobic magnesium-protoporphyrin IX monomethyl ester cyclase
MSKKVLLLTPPYHTGIIEITGNWSPLNLVYLAGHLRAAAHSVEIYDAMTKNHTIDEVRRQVFSKNPDIVMIGAYTSSINCALDVLRLAKIDNPHIITCLGGVHATFCYDEILTGFYGFVDYIIRGEGERTIVELTDALEAGNNLTEIPGLAFYREGKVVVTPDRKFADNLDELIPAWDLLEWEDYFFKLTDRRLAVVSSSRGCNHNCRFCSQHLFWKGTYRERTPQNFVKEIEYLHNTFGVGSFMLADEYTTKNRDRWERILDLLIEKGLDIHLSLETRVEDILRDEDIIHKYRLAGVIHVYVGVESVNQKTLEDYAKQLQVEQSKKALDILNNAGIITECSFIMGGPDETADSMDMTLQTAIDFNPDLAHFLLITPWPYAEIYKELEPYITEKDYSKYHFVYPIVKPKSMEIKEVWEKLINCFRVFYLGKAKQNMKGPEGIKKQYMLKAIEIMHKEFFTTNFGKSVIKPPEGLTL